MKIKFSPELVAPCGINCALCQRYHQTRGYDKKGERIPLCLGCRPRKRKCFLMKARKDCPLLKDKIDSCIQCQFFPCWKLEKLNEGYQTKYYENLTENLLEIKKMGLKKWLKKERKYWSCSRCGEVICVHDRKCFNCQAEELVKKKEVS